MVQRGLGTLGLGAIALLSLGVGCVGSIGSGQPDDGAGNGGPGGGNENDPLSCVEGAIQVAPHPMRRLTPAQYVNTVRDLFGDAGFSAELEAGGDVITEREVRQLRDAAEAIALRQGSWTKPVFACDIDGPADEGCFEELLDGFAARAFRRPLTDAERARFTAVYDDSLAIGTFAEAMEMVVQVVLQSPAVLYMFETGSPDTTESAHLLTDHEVATRLSYFLWNTTPDDTLLEAASAGGLRDEAGLTAAAYRMLDDPRADYAVQQFMSSWLQLDGGTLHHPLEEAEKEASLYPEFDAELVGSMRLETQALVRKVFQENGTFADLLTSRQAYVNAPMAELYGVSGPADADSWEWVELDGQQRAGLLTRAAFLTTFSTKNVTAPIRRGVWVLKEMLCRGLGDPPPNVNNIPPEGGNVDGEQRTVRRDVDVRTQGDTCMACHALINPIGYTFEHYDAIGRYQTSELTSGLAIDATGNLPDAGKVDGAIALSADLAALDEARNCLAERWYQQAVSEHIDTADACSVQAIQTKVGPNGTLRDLVVAIIVSDAFRYVDVEEAQ